MRILITMAALLLLSAAGFPQSPDTLLDLRYWPASEGGNDHYYAIVPIAQTWDDHRTMLESLVYNGDTGYLVTISSPAENAFLRGLASDHPEQPYGLYHTGGYSRWQGSDWVWETDLEPMTYTRWKTSYPAFERTIAFQGGARVEDGLGQWIGIMRDTVETPDPNQLLWALVEFGDLDTIGFVPDTLIDVRQWPASEGGNDHYYGIIDIWQTWQDQAALAPTLQFNGETGYLATIRSYPEQQFVVSLISDHLDQEMVDNHFCLGAQYDTISDQWFWPTGEPWFYNHDDFTYFEIGHPRRLLIKGVAEDDYPGKWLNGTPESPFWAVVEFGPVDTTTYVPDTLIAVTQWPASEGGNDHYYGIIDIAQAWTAHQALAPTLSVDGQSGYLVSIRSPQEQAFVTDLIDDYTTKPSAVDYFYIGGGLGTSGFEWASGEAFYYENIYPGPGKHTDTIGTPLNIRGVASTDFPFTWHTQTVPLEDELWGVVEFGPLDPHLTVDSTVVDIKQWLASEGGNDHYYGIIPYLQSWNDHQALAQTLSYDSQEGYLASIRSAEENQFVFNLIANHNYQPTIKNQFFLGLEKVDGYYQWTSGESVTYVNWATGEPSGENEVGAIFGLTEGARSSQWNDLLADPLPSEPNQLAFAVIEFGVPDLSSCCVGTTGNVDADPSGTVALTDLTVLVNALFGNSGFLPCPAAANTSGDPQCNISLTDITLLANHLFVTFEPLAACNPACE